MGHQFQGHDCILFSRRLEEEFWCDTKPDHGVHGDDTEQEAVLTKTTSIHSELDELVATSARMQQRKHRGGGVLSSRPTTRRNGSAEGVCKR